MELKRLGILAAVPLAFALFACEQKSETTEPATTEAPMSETAPTEAPPMTEPAPSEAPPMTEPAPSEAPPMTEPAPAPEEPAPGGTP